MAIHVLRISKGETATNLQQQQQDLEIKTQDSGHFPRLNNSGKETLFLLEIASCLTVRNVLQVILSVSLFEL